MTTPDFVHSPWTPEDDQLLRTSIEAGFSLAALTNGAVKFSCKFTLREIQDRWHSLLYGTPDDSPSQNESMMKNATCIDESGPSETPLIEKLTENNTTVCGVCGGKHHFNPPISDGSASLWRTMQDILALDMPVDENNAEIQQVVEEALALHDDKSL
ncbi:uncharacterized protein LOC110866293 [Helianthus annuus]|uniref:uncharacterized protein LOC110866293 n=1 Tax=Helianthus annuus TaxID=4232 RepID=UPI000B900B64|nr:uncharacterized protein LOC110866293 [Helianthus annuus]